MPAVAEILNSLLGTRRTSSVNAANENTAPRRSPLVRAAARELESDSRRGVAAQAIMVPNNAKMDRWSFAYHTNRAKEANLTSTPPGGVLNVTVLVSVSGHTGEVETFAADPNQTFEVFVTDPNGNTQTYTIKRDSPKGKQYVAMIDLNIPVTQEGTYIISGAPSGSGGPGGYIEGREYRLHVGQKNFFKRSSLPSGVTAYRE